MNAQENTNQTAANIDTSIMAALKAHIESHHTNGTAWPDDAVFAVVSRCSTWPCGWSDTSHVDFFDSRETMDKWMETQIGWAKCEDNYIAWMVYEWDLGPNHRPEFDRNAYRV